MPSNFFSRFRSIISNKTLLNGALFALFSFFNRGIGFVLLLVLAKYITPGEYGTLNLFNTVLMVLTFVTALSTEGYFSVAYFRDGESGVKNAYSSIFFTTLITTAILCLILFVGNQYVADLLDLPLFALYIAVIVGFLTAHINVNLDFFRVKEDIVAYGLVSCGYAVLGFLLTILLVVTILPGWEGRVYAQLNSALLCGLFALIYFWRKKLIKLPDTQYWKQMLLWGIPLIPHAATNFLRQGCDRYIINHHYSLDEVGIFSFALNLCNVIIMIGLSFNQSSSVEICKVLADKQTAFTNKQDRLMRMTRSMFFVYLISTVGVCLGGFLLVPLLLPSYTSSLNFFPLLSLYGFLQCLYYLFANYLFYYKDTKVLMYITFGTSVMHLVLSLLLTHYSLYLTSVVYILVQATILFFVVNRAKSVVAKYND